MGGQTIQKLWINASMAVLMLGVSACGGKTPPETPSPPEVKFMSVEGRNVTLTRELPGRVSAFQVSEVRPQVGGIIQKRLFEEGSDVTAGQVLYQIDPALYDAAYKNAKAALAKEEANLATTRLLAQRYAKLVRTGAVGKQECDDAQAAYKQAMADVDAARENLETARINLGYTEVKAPVSGRIGRSLVTVGALATQNQPDPLATVQQLSPVYIDMTQPNSEMLDLRLALAAGRLRSSDGDSAKIRLKLENGAPYIANPVAAQNGEDAEWIEGDLQFSDVTIERSTGVVSIRALIANPDNVLLPGMYVRALLEEGVRENAVLVPQRAVMRDTRGRPMVYVLTKEIQSGGDSGATPLKPEEYRIESRPVVIDRDYGNNWLLDKGLEPGERLLVEGHVKVRPGQIVIGETVSPQTSSQTSSVERQAHANASR